MTLNYLDSRESISNSMKGEHMANLEAEYAENFNYDDLVVTVDEAEDYAKQVAKEAIEKYIATTKSQPQEKPMTKNPEINSTIQAIVTETDTNTKLITGEVLLENIETLADKLVLSNLSWWKRMTLSKQNKEVLATLATYAIVHAIKTGGFGLTKYRINHVALDYVTLAANQRLLKYVMKSSGVNTNVAEMLLSLPTITKGE